MFPIQTRPSADARALLAALDRSLAMITFNPTGIIVSANENFCRVFGYALSEIVGRHHSMFVDPDYAASHTYQEFWLKLGRGEFDSKEYKRLGRDGREVWIQATYNPVLDANGRVTRVVKLAVDLTQEKTRRAENDANGAAAAGIGMIEFSPQGEILSANEVFLATVGYTLAEIKGQHHRMFVSADYASSAEYDAFWRQLNHGNPVAGEFERVGKGGSEIWLQACYNPVTDSDGNILKIVKVATDTTGRMHAIKAVGLGLQELSANNLTYRISQQLDPAFAQLRSDYNKAAEQLAHAVGGVTDNISGIRSITGEISRAADDLSRRTEQQAATLEQTAGALAQITETVRRTGSSAQTANAVVLQTRAKADRYGAIVQQAVTAMSSIEHSARQISQIVGVIDEIAFQTNLLALNAGVEAARAGDAGRGFAVVASEVRALAQRSKDAAREINTLITNSTQQVGHGVELVGDTGRALKEMVDQFADIDSAVTEIAAAAEEQAVALGGVNAAIDQLDQVTQQNAAMVEQSAEATQLLAGETELAAELASQFTVSTPRAERPRPNQRASQVTEIAYPALKLVSKQPAVTGER